LNIDWVKLVEQLEKEGITPKEANKMIRGYQMITMVMKTVNDIGEEVE
jgi:hypothetical protein